MHRFLQRLADKAAWLLLVVLGPVGWFAMQMFEDQVVTAAKGMAGQPGVKAAAVAVGRFWFERPVTVTAIIALVTLGVSAVVSAAQGRGGRRHGAKRLNELAEHAIIFIVNETGLPPKQLLKRLRTFEADALRAMKQEECSETEQSEFKVLGDVDPIHTPGPTDEHRHIQRIAFTKARRLRAAAARLEGHLSRASTTIAMRVPPPPAKLRPISARVEVKSTKESSGDKDGTLQIVWLIHVVNREDVPLLLTGNFHVVTDQGTYNAYRVWLDNLPDMHPLEVPARSSKSILVEIEKQFPKAIPAALQHRIKYPEGSEHFVRHDLILNDLQSRRSMTVGYGRPYDEIESR